MTEEKRRSCCSFWKGLSTVVGITAGIKAAWIIFSHTAIEHNAHLSGVVDAPKQFYVSEVAGGINYYSDSRGTQRPILLIHGIHPAAGSHDMAAILIPIVPFVPSTSWICLALVLLKRRTKLSPLPV